MLSPEPPPRLLCFSTTPWKNRAIVLSSRTAACRGPPKGATMFSCCVELSPSTVALFGKMGEVLEGLFPVIVILVLAVIAQRVVATLHLRHHISRGCAVTASPATPWRRSTSVPSGDGVAARTVSCPSRSTMARTPLRSCSVPTAARPFPRRSSSPRSSAS